MQGHSAANIIPVAAANRIGTERVKPCSENAGQESALEFYGSSFLTDETGEVVARAGRDSEEIIFAEYDFDSIKASRLSWGLFRDRRPECYEDMCF
jgi:N-carbamoylputrescine amidase